MSDKGCHKEKFEQCGKLENYILSPKWKNIEKPKFTVLGTSMKNEFIPQSNSSLRRSYKICTMADNSHKESNKISLEVADISEN